MEQPPPGLAFTKTRPIPIIPVFANGVQIYHDTDNHIVTIGFGFFTSFEEGDEVTEEGIEVAKIVMSIDSFEALVAQVAKVLERMQNDPDAEDSVEIQEAIEE